MLYYRENYVYRLFLCKYLGVTAYAAQFFEIHADQSMQNAAMNSFLVAEWLTHSHASHEVTGSRPSFSVISHVHSSIRSIRSATQINVKWSVVITGRPKHYLVIKIGVVDKYQTKL